jgi:teichuronic acid biosynthesis glycosyltransferase TuaG
MFGMPGPGTTAPLVSIITPAYNAARFVEATIRSVQAQTIHDWEMLVVDDASDDGTREIVAGLAAADPRVRLLALPGNRGAAGARNTALEQARGRYVAFLDSDDLWLPHKLARQLEFMRTHDSAFCFAEYSYIDENGKRIGRRVRVPATIDYDGLLRNTIIGCLTVVVDRERTGPLRMSSLPQHEDLVLWLALLKRGLRAHGIPEELALYRVVRRSASRDKVRSALHMWKVYRRQERLPVPHALWCYAHYAWNAYWKNLI